LFFFFFFFKMSTWSPWPSPPRSSSICSTTWNVYQPILHTLRTHRLVARVSSIHQNQTRAFTPTRHSHPFPSLPFPSLMLCKAEHWNPNGSFGWGN
jgi:hypothetical protein